MPTAKGSACIGCGILFLIIGIILSVGGSIFFKYDLNNILKKDISKNVLTLSPSSQFWQNWINQGGPFNVSFYAYDLLNVNEVLLGKKANFSLKGPYSYIQYEELTDIQFTADNEEVSYNYFTYYVLNDYENEKNKVHPNTDTITNINPAFLAVLINAGSELNLLFALGVYTLDEYFIWGQQNLLNFSLAKENAFVLNSRIENVISNLQSNYNLSKEAATETFLSIWANATAPPTQYPSIDWTGLLLSDGASSSGISIESATNLLGSSDSLALLNSSQSSWSPWGWILNGNTTYTQSVASHFGLTAPQMNQVVNWLSFFTTFYTTPYILEYYDLKQLSDVVYSQYASYTPLGISIAHVNPPIQYQWDHTVESAQSTVVYDSIEQMKAVFSDGPYNLRNGTNYALFLQTALSNNPNYTIFGLSFNQGQNLSNQLESYGQFSPNYLSSWMSSGKTGLFVTQSVNNWIFGCTDQLVNVLEPGSACGLQVNNTYLPGNNIIKTGKTNISDIQRYIQWHGLTEIEGIWAETVPIHGYSEYGQFKPMLEKDEVIRTWDGSTLRNINFQQNGMLKVHGVPVYDYFMPNETFAASALFNQPNISGVANMTASSQGAPIYLGFFDLIGVPAKYSTDKINGLNQNLSNAITHLQVEPYLGLAMSAQKRMQINSFLSEYIVTNFLNSQYVNYSTVLDEVFYPLVQIELKAEATKAQADQIKSALFVAIYRDTFFYSFLGGGIGLAVIGIILLAVGIHQYKNRDYIAIN